MPCGVPRGTTVAQQHFDSGYQTSFDLSSTLRLPLDISFNLSALQPPFSLPNFATVLSLGVRSPTLSKTPCIPAALLSNILRVRGLLQPNHFLKCRNRPRSSLCSTPGGLGWSQAPSGLEMYFLRVFSTAPLALLPSGSGRSSLHLSIWHGLSGFNLIHA
jgi:hypothetical protein